VAARSQYPSHLDPALRAKLTAEFRERWSRAGYPTLVQHILGNMSQAHGVPLVVLKDIARDVRAEQQQVRPARAAPTVSVTGAAPLAVVDGSNIAWARTSEEGHPRLDNLSLVRAALAERGYQSLVVVDAALRHQLGHQDAGELDRQIAAQEVVQVPAATDADLWVCTIADHHRAPVVSNDRFDEYSADFPWLSERRVAVVLAEHAALLQGHALDGSGRPPESPAALREEIDRLRQSAAAAQTRAEDIAALRGRVANLEGYLAREQARSAAAQAEGERLSQELAEERRMTDTLRQELRQHPEQLARLSTQLADAQADAATARGQRDALQDRVRDLERQLQQLSTRRPEERGAAATRADLDALAGSLRGEIRDLGRALRDVQSPLPRILAMTREVRESVHGIQASQAQTGEALQRLEGASESLTTTADYLVTLAEEDQFPEDFEDFEDSEDSEESVGSEASDEPDDVEDFEDGEDVGEAESASTDDAEDDAADEGQSPSTEEDWQADYDRIEEAWLDARRVGDPHEAVNFLHLIGDLHFDDKSPEEILAAFDKFRARAGGEKFSYCPLHGAVHLVRMKKPSLDNGLVLVRYRELARLPPCKSLEDCPGVGYSVSEILSRG
jgi:polyhydroxyalkanoate synthesis regulator phasin